MPIDNIIKSQAQGKLCGYKLKEDRSFALSKEYANLEKNSLR